MYPKYIRPALFTFIALTVICGVCYPLLITILAQTLFPQQANGSLIVNKGKVVGSSLIGQPFSDPGYFWSRPSATTPAPYNAAASQASNLGPSNPALFERVKSEIALLHRFDSANADPIPVDLVTTSASGLDPHVSVAAALWQAPRVARVRGKSVGEIRTLVARFTEERQLGIFGEPRVNVLRLNLALDDSSSQKGE
jgi:K+-transporting ATPase ATPase C chain